MPLRFKIFPSLLCVLRGRKKKGESHFCISQPFSRVGNGMTKDYEHICITLSQTVSACLLLSGHQTSSVFRMPVSAYHRASHRGRECETAVRNQPSSCQCYNALWSIMSVYSCPRNVKKITIASLTWHYAFQQQDSLSVRKWNVTDIRTKKQSSAHFVTQ